MTAFIVVSYIVCKPVAHHTNLLGWRYWDNFGIQNIFTRARYQEALQHLHFANNRKQDKTDKAIKLNQLNGHKQSIDKHRTLFNDAVLQNQTYKLGFKLQFCGASSTGYLNEFD